MKVIIAGGRYFNDYVKLCKMCDSYLYLYPKQGEIEIVSGTANGADKLGEQYAKERGYKIKRFPADWNKFGKKAGYLRNKQMAEYAHLLIAFWDGASKGTKLMIDLAEEHKLHVRIKLYKYHELI